MGVTTTYLLGRAGRDFIQHRSLCGAGGAAGYRNRLQRLPHPQRCVCPRGRSLYRRLLRGCSSFTGCKGCWNGELTGCRRHGGGWGFSFLSPVFVQTRGALVLSPVAGGVKRGLGRAEGRCLLPVTCQVLQQSGTYSSCGFCCLHTKAQQYFAIVEEQM